jgi:hypothetical protein
VQNVNNFKLYFLKELVVFSSSFVEFRMTLIELQNTNSPTPNIEKLLVIMRNDLLVKCDCKNNLNPSKNFQNLMFFLDIQEIF